MINFALFGAGRIGSIHSANVVTHKQASLVGVCDPYQPNVDKLIAELGCSQMTEQEIFSDDHIDAILICSATDTHVDLIHQAVAAGKHVFCEKPIDLSLERVQQCTAIVEQSDCKSLVAFNRRFDPNFQLLQQQIAAGQIGSVELVSIISKDPSPPPVEYLSSSGGLFRDMTIHDFDMARFLLDEEIEAVSAQASCLVNPAIGAAGDVDTAAITLTTINGKLVQISNSRRACFGYDQRIEVHGSKGLLVAQNVNEHTVTTYSESGANSAKPLYFFLERYEASYRAELDSFIRALQGEAVSYPSMNDGLQALMLAEAALLSSQSGRTVKLTEIN